MKKFEVIENNGGGLMLVVFDSEGKVEYLHDGYEGHCGQLTEDLENLRSEDIPIKDWDGNVDNPQEYYKDSTSLEYGWEVVADNDGIYPEKMGGAAMMEFRVGRYSDDYED